MVSGKLSETERSTLANKNRPSIVLWEAARAVAVSIAMLIALIALLGYFSVR